MKFSVNKTNLEEGLSIVERAISNRNTLPVLNNVFLEVKDNKLQLITTNLEICIKTNLEITQTEEGKTTTPVKLLSNYISLLKDQDIDIEIKEGEVLNLKANESKTTIKGISTEDFPLIPTIDIEKSIKIKVKDFIENVSKIVFASALDELRPVLAGVLFKIEKGDMYTVATDSYRLVETFNKTEYDCDFSIIIPSKTILELSRIIHKYDKEDLLIDISKNQVRFKCDKIELTSRLIEGQYPNYKKIIPEKIETKAVVNTDDFVTAIKRASLFAKENSNNIKLEIQKGKVFTIVDSTQIGSENSYIEAETVGDDKKIAFNAQYLLEALSNIPTDTVEIGVNSSITPGVIKATNNDSVVHVIMPLKV